MRFLSIYKTKETGVPPSPEHIAAMGKLIDEMMKTGVLIGTEGCLPSAQGARIRITNGNFTVTDGPFTESKELISYALYEVRSKEEAIEWASRFIKAHRDLWPGWEGRADILQVMGPDNGG